MVSFEGPAPGLDWIRLPAQQQRKVFKALPAVSSYAGRKSGHTDQIGGRICQNLLSPLLLSPLCWGFSRDSSLGQIAIAMAPRTVTQDVGLHAGL